MKKRPQPHCCLWWSLLLLTLPAIQPHVKLINSVWTYVYSSTLPYMYSTSVLLVVCSLILLLASVTWAIIGSIVFASALRREWLWLISLHITCDYILHADKWPRYNFHTVPGHLLLTPPLPFSHGAGGRWCGLSLVRCGHPSLVLHAAQKHSWFTPSPLTEGLV